MTTSIIAGWRSAPFDAEAVGREQWADSTPEQRAAALPTVVRYATNAPTEQERRWAQGWLDAHERESRR